MPVDVDGVDGNGAAEGRENGALVDGALPVDAPNVNGTVVVAPLDNVFEPKPPNAGKDGVVDEEGKVGAADCCVLLDGNENGPAEPDNRPVLPLPLLLDDTPNVKPVPGNEEDEAEDDSEEDEEDPPNAKGEAEADGIDDDVDAANAGLDAPNERVDAAGTEGAVEAGTPPNVNVGSAAVLDDGFATPANDGADCAKEDEPAAPNVNGDRVGAAVFFSGSGCLVSGGFVALLLNANGVVNEEVEVESSDEDEEDADDERGVKVNGVDDGAPNEKIGWNAAAFVSSSSSAAPPPPALSSSHDV